MDWDGIGWMGCGGVGCDWTRGMLMSRTSFGAVAFLARLEGGPTALGRSWTTAFC